MFITGQMELGNFLQEIDAYHGREKTVGKDTLVLFVNFFDTLVLKAAGG